MCVSSQFRTGKFGQHPAPLLGQNLNFSHFLSRGLPSSKLETRYLKYEYEYEYEYEFKKILNCEEKSEK